MAMVCVKNITIRWDIRYDALHTGYGQIPENSLIFITILRITY
jgi:hypothetical protein